MRIDVCTPMKDSASELMAMSITWDGSLFLCKNLSSTVLPRFSYTTVLSTVTIMFHVGLQTFFILELEVWTFHPSLCVSPTPSRWQPPFYSQFL